ncbi:hypothetical protein Leryth_007039 [Lithospermum erythrorhizon]|nr:hypothetical protein Leryth_007039 [Lithospermum erythrorhizon]
MSFTQMALCSPSTNLTFIRPHPNAYVGPACTRLLPKTSGELSFRSPSCLHTKIPNVSLRLSNTALKGNRHSPVCYFSRNNNADKADEPSPWNTLEKGMEIEDVLRYQMERKEYADDGRGSGSWFGGGGSWFRGGRWRGGGGSEDDGFREMLHEYWQVILATAGFVFLYMLLIEGEAITRMGKDILKFIFTGKKSIRLARTMDFWQNLFLQLVWRRKSPMTLTG